MKRLPDTELEVMKALWAQEGGATRADLEHALKDKGWASNTINTYLSRLCEKGFVSCEKRGKANWYAPWCPRPTTSPLRAALCWTRFSASL